MAQKKLRLMISSRSENSSIDDGAGARMPLREARLALKRDIEAADFLAGGLVEVWINEDEHGDGAGTSWDECIEQARSCDLFIALYDGDPGWAPKGGSVGICAAEFEMAFGAAPSKVKILRLPDAKVVAGNKLAEDFRDSLAAANRYETHIKKDWVELRSRMLELVREMFLAAAHEGARDYRKSSTNIGLALDWSRMTFAERSRAIAETIAGAIALRKGKANTADPKLVVAQVEGDDLIFACHVAPRSLSVAAARELVGQPFLSDHRIAETVGTQGIGPVHLIGCPKGVTENQAVSLLGFPDFTVVEGSFGVYAADRVQKIQLCLLADCADPGSTRNSVDRFFEWLSRSGELPLLAERAKSRRRIIDAILKET